MIVVAIEFAVTENKIVCDTTEDYTDGINKYLPYFF